MRTPTVAIADFGTGNLHSVINAMEAAANQDCKIVSTCDAARIRAADRLVLPGQGAIGAWMQQLSDPETRAAVENALAAKPVLGICLGMQALYQASAEDGGTAGLGLLSGQVRKFDARLRDAGQRIKIPHMGWNIVTQVADHPLWAGIRQHARFYFVHSYYADASRASEIAAVTDYGAQYASAAAKDNVFAVQFHPEKSRAPGLRLLRNFLQWNGMA